MNYLIFLLISFLLVGAFQIISSENLNLLRDQDRDEFFQNYKLWLGSLSSNVIDISAYIIKTDWAPKLNKTNG